MSKHSCIARCLIAVAFVGSILVTTLAHLHG
jgi:hypothetical protein